MSAIERVRLVAPHTSGGGKPLADPVWEAPRYVRTREMTRWHRVRSGRRRHSDGRVTWHLWCGQHLGDAEANAIAADAPPAGEPACGTCEGRALGAGQDDNPLDVDLAFEPRGITPPAWCPGGGHRGPWVALADSVGRCLVCGHLGKLSWRRYPHDGQTFQPHRPGPDLVEACPFHGWKQFGARDGQLFCQPCTDGWPWQ